ncbi:MAG: hypothetical protein C4517_11890 [Stygiobacter sp.]|nr:MAG: hypothetical protein C4517_11890 [Stygiobacter sp.]
MLQAQESILYDGELRIHILNSYSGLQLNFEATIVSSSHWDFGHNLVSNSDYTYQQSIVTYPNTNVYFNWEIGNTYGMGKGLYQITVRNTVGNVLAYFYYNTRTTKHCSSADLEINYNVSNSVFSLISGGTINNQTLDIWNYVDCMCCDPEINLFEPQAPTNLFVYSSCGHPQLYWNNNAQEDYWTNVDVYRGEVYSGYPSSFSLIASLPQNTTSYYDTRYTTGSGAVAYYKVCKRNVERNSAFSNVVNISIIPQKIVEENPSLSMETESEKSKTALFQNYPNPFNPTTEITFELTENSIIHLEVFDILGRKVETLAEGYFNKGIHRINFNR